MVDLSKWKEERHAREEGKEIVLPSGNSALVRPIGFDLLLKSKHIPDALTALIMDVMDGKMGVVRAETVERRLELLQLVDVVAQHMFLQPKVVERPTADDEIAADDISLTDKLYLFGLVGGGAAALADFRPQQIQNVDSVDAPAGTPQASE